MAHLKAITIGQHHLGKPATLHRGPIESLELVGSLANGEPASCAIDPVSQDLVATADLLVFPIGSFFGSILANFMPRGVGKAVVNRQCPKLYIPNSGCDPEMKGHSIADCTAQIIALVRKDVAMCAADAAADAGATAATAATAAPAAAAATAGDSDDDEPAVPVSDILNYVLVDSSSIEYEAALDIAAIEALGVSVLDCKLSVEDGGDKAKLDPGKVVEVLLSLAC